MKVTSQMLALVIFSTSFIAWSASPTLKAKIVIPSGQSDLSSFTHILEDGTPANRMDSFGSSAHFDPSTNILWTLSDRGPGDGIASYPTRFQQFHLDWDGSNEAALTLKSTVPLKDYTKDLLIGISSSLPTAKCGGHRWDPEGIAPSGHDTFFIAEEYGPSIAEFNKQGERIRDFKIPKTFQVLRPHANPAKEVSDNSHGRVPNKGFEGLTLTRDGKHLLTALQGALHQDGVEIAGKIRGNNIRFTLFSIKTGQAVRQMAYVMDDKNFGINEVLSIADNKYLVIERDSNIGKAAKFKRIYMIDTTQASDISSVDRLPHDSLPSDITPIKKTLVIDLLDSKHGLAGQDFPEKLEALSWIPKNGKNYLLIGSDNDFLDQVDSHFWIFEVGSEFQPSTK